MRYTVEYTPRAVEDLKGLTPQAANLVYSWVEKNLVGCEDPRTQGTGRKRGGRWRYKVGTYRLVCEIEESRIVILAVTSEVEDALSPRDRRGNAKRRAPSVFLKSTARQPVKSAALLVVTALLTFAFVSRGAEWLLLTQETERLEGFYRFTGGIQEIKGSRGYLNDRPRGADASEVIAYLEESPYVERVDVRRSLSAVAPDFGHSGTTTVGNVNYYSTDVLFYGTLQSVAQTQNADGHLEGDYRFSFLVDEAVVGTKSMIQEGELADLVNPQDFSYWTGGSWRKGTEEFEAAYVDMTDVAGELEVGQRYLLRGSLDDNKPGVVRGGTVTDPDGTQRKVTPSLWFKPLVEDGPWYLPVTEGEADFSDPRIAGLLEEMKIYDDNQHAYRVWACEDMSAMVTTSDWTDAQTYLVDGRWLTAEDTELKRPVCVVWNNYEDPADGVQVGDTITMKLRDITPPAVYSGPAVGDNLYWVAYQEGLLCQEEDFARLDEIEATSVTMDFEVVGTYSFIDWTTECIGKTFIPVSLVPENFTHTLEVPEAREIAFELTGPEVQDAFLAESAGDLAELGFRIVMPESGWANFKEATGPIVRSSLYNALVFAAVMAAGLAIVTVVYFYMRRKELPIARAMGLPARTCVRQIVTPVLLLAGAPGIALGALFGWWWTAQNAGDTLSALAEFGTIAPSALPGTYLAAMAGIAFVLLAGMGLLSAALMVRRPVLELLQGAARAAVAEVAAGTAEPSPFAASQPQAAAVHIRPAPERKTKLGLRAGLTFRFVWRQASRARLKTALTILLAAGFTVGLAAIQLAIAGSQERIDWLYEHTPVEAELVPTGPSYAASIRRDTVQALMDSGCITEYHFEANVTVGSGCAPYEEDQDGAVYLSRKNSQSRTLLGFESERAFLSTVGSGSGVTITYHDGWNGSLFAGSYTGDYDPADSGTLFPVIVPKGLYDELELGPGGKLQVFARSRRPFEVAGYYEGLVNGNDPEPLLLPLSACQTLCNGRLSYSKAHVTLDPSMNRQLDRLEAVLTEIAGRQSSIKLRAVIWDEELRQAVAPLEGSIRLMRVLYPVTLVLSLLCAAGVAVLFIMTSAKEAAILRVQGTTKLRTRVILGLQQTLTCAAGLAMGLVGVLLYVGSARPNMLDGIAAGSALCALGYLIAAVAGSIASASVVTGKHPLEMLQVKE